MKRVIVAILVVVALLSAGCDSKNKPHVLRNGEFVYINIRKGGMRVIEDNTIPTVEGDPFERMTPREVVEKCIGFYFYATDMGQITSLGIGDEQKDIENARIKMWGQMIINADGTLNEAFLDWRDVRIMTTIPEGNVCAYIPNQVMREASEKIRKAYKEGNNDEVYRLFKDSFTGIPITEKEWENLKKQGKQ